jgi:AcrR family transcriptional regulator
MARMPRPRAVLDTCALADAFSTAGPASTSSTALAAALGVAKPTLYAHGQSKAALFALAVEAECERVLDRLAAVEARTAGRSARDRAVATCGALLDHAAARPAGWRLLHAHARDAPAVRRLVGRLAAGLARDLTADGLDAREAPWLAEALWGACGALGAARPGEPRRPPRRRLAELAAAPVPAAPRAAAEDWPAA